MRADRVVACSLALLQVMQLQQFYCHSRRIRCKCFDTALTSVLTILIAQIIFCLNSMLAWITESQLAVDLLEKWSAGYIKMDCKGNKCYGVLAVRAASDIIRPSRFTPFTTTGAQVVFCSCGLPHNSSLDINRRQEHEGKEGCDTEWVSTSMPLLCLSFVTMLKPETQVGGVPKSLRGLSWSVLVSSYRTASLCSGAIMSRCSVLLSSSLSVWSSWWTSHTVGLKCVWRNGRRPIPVFGNLS